MGASAADLRIVGKYEILSQLAEGSVTALFIAKADIGRDAVGLEQLVKAVRGDPDSARLFLEEAQLTAKLVHPNVIRVHELSVDKKRGDPYRVLELVSGQSLAMLMKTVSRKGYSLPLPVACRIVHDACLGLHAAHALGQFHGSITPQCIKLTHQGEVKLTDFGLSRVRHALRVAHPGKAFGTLSYIAPEQVLQNPVDARTDVFAMATILWELLTGRRLQENEAAAPRAVVIEAAPAPSSLAPDVSAKLDALVLEGLEKNPDLRQDSAGALARALAAVAPLAPHAEIAVLMETVFGDRRAAFEAQLERLTADEPEGITANGYREEPTRQLEVPADEERTRQMPAVREEERTRVDRPAPAISDAVWPTQQANTFDLPPPTAKMARPPPSAPRPPASVFDGLPMAPPPARQAPPSASRPPANIFEGLSPAPPPARSPRAPPSVVFDELPPAPPPARASRPPPSVVFDDLPPAPPANIFEALPPAPPPRAQRVPVEEPAVVVGELQPEPPAKPPPSAPRPEPAPRPPPPTPTIEAPAPSSFMLAYDRVRWVLALSLLATAIGVCATWWIKTTPAPKPRPPPAQALD